VRRAAGALAVILIAVALGGCSVRGPLADATTASSAPAPSSTTSTPAPNTPPAGAVAAASDSIASIEDDLAELDNILNLIDKKVKSGEKSMGKAGKD
jgi:hypothetical protein